MAEHVVPVRVYLAVFAALMVLTATTTTVAFVDLGRLNVVIMLVIAATKATLVVLYFMHVRWSSRFTWVVVTGGFVWLGLLVGFTLSDMVVRDLLRPELSQIERGPEP
jgi:cytochrome c oxidase subunit 4